jgi:beta-lactam-binding protein with PASTA domain
MTRVQNGHVRGLSTPATTDSSSRRPSTIVIRQAPRAGETLPSDGAVDLVVGRGGKG